MKSKCNVCIWMTALTLYGCSGDYTEQGGEDERDMFIEAAQDMSARVDLGEADMPNPPQRDQGVSGMDMTDTPPTPVRDQGVTPQPQDMAVRPMFMGVVDPECIDGQYSEELPTQADISAYTGSYSPANNREFYEGILGLRYPMGAKLVSEASRAQLDCVDAFSGGAFSAEDALRDLNTIVHECGHFYDLGNGGFSDSHYAINLSLSFQCSEGDTTSRGGRTFERSRIRNDSFAAMRPGCQQGQGCDFYASVYLDGNPDDAMFEGGDQGYNSVLEETVQYVNSLATGYAFRDTYQFSQSDRDGILTFLWYLGRYLHMARTQYPDAYAHISQDDCWRRATLTVWGRAWLFLEATRGESKLGIEDAQIEPLVLDPTILNEIELLRNIEGCTP